MWLCTEGAPVRLRNATSLHSDQCENCTCGANPVRITGPRQEVYMTGPRAQRLVLGWALKRPNPADLDAAGKPRPYSVAWDAWSAEAERCMADSARESCVNTGFPLFDNDDAGRCCPVKGGTHSLQRD